MAKFFVGQMVKLVNSRIPENIGSEGRIVALGFWEMGDLLPNGRPLVSGSADLLVDWGSIKRTMNGGLDRVAPVESARVEPILPEGAQPSEFSFTELMDNLGVVVA